MVTIVNLTSDCLNIYRDNKIILRVPPSGRIAYCTPATIICSYINTIGIDIPCSRNILGDIVGLPAEEEGVLYFTSGIVAQIAWSKGRRDVVCPLSPVYDKYKTIIGTTGLTLAPYFYNFSEEIPRII